MFCKNRDTFDCLIACFHDTVDDSFHVLSEVLMISVSWSVRWDRVFAYGITTAKLEWKGGYYPLNLHLSSY
jgi:hypothetical protein